MKKPSEYVAAIAASGHSIYTILPTSSELYIPTNVLESLLNNGLRGFSTKGMPIRTRSKAVKSAICRILGYPVPSSFKKEQPRFPAQNFDTYIQKSNNLQIWNEIITPDRRYAIIRQGENDELISVRVVTGAILAKLDRTGTLTQKYQARFEPSLLGSELVSKTDTECLTPHLGQELNLDEVSPLDVPRSKQLLPIADVYSKLLRLVGASFNYVGSDQERNRGAEFHRLVCQALGYKNYSDDGSFPDIRHQLLEVKLQTSPTIDLGKECPNSEEPLSLPFGVRPCDVRYAIVDAKVVGEKVVVNGLYLTNGRDFFSKFPQFGGKVINSKLQIPLPSSFFD